MGMLATRRGRYMGTSSALGTDRIDAVMSLMVMMFQVVLVLGCRRAR